MSADPLGGLLGGPVEQHGIVEEAPALIQHDQEEWDFRLDVNEDYLANDSLADLEQTTSNVGPDAVRANYGFTGIGQTVAVIDSGIAYDHNALGGGYGSNYRVVGGWDFAENDADPYDDGAEGSHGTHVAGIVGATGDNNGNNVGVAPGVDLVALRVFNDAGTGSFSWVESALQWVIDNRTAFENPITAVNLSLGTVWNSDTTPSWAMLEDEFAELNAVGVFIAVSAGNSFTSYNQPGLSYPASSPYVVPVASVDNSGSLSYFSQRLDRAIAAPGRFIRSTVPDYAGNNNGVADDWANFSGTSMASPYVAGASVLIREAMELVGYSNITQEMIYDHMVATADSIFDSITSQSYNRLNLEAAIDALLPDDDYGSTVATAQDLGNLSASTQISGMVSTLNDVDYFTFTAGVTGTATWSASTTDQLAAEWDFGSQSVSQNGNEWVMNIVAGQTYTVGLSSSDGLGYYDLNVAVDSTFSFVDWGSVTGQQQQSNLAIGGETWYRIAAGQAGYVTAEAFFASGQGDVDIAFYDASLTLIASSTQVAGGERIDTIASAGEDIFLRVSGSNSDVDFRLTNQVAIAGTTLSVTGSTANDTISFVAGANYDVTVNGVDYSFASSSIAAVVIDAGGGDDSIDITGSSASETVRLYFTQTTMTGGGFDLTAIGFDNVVVQSGGGANDQAFFYDTSGDEQFTGWSDRATFIGADFSREVFDFDRVTAYATTGNDTATFYDTAGDDFYATWWNRAVMYGDGFWNDARGFDQATAYATSGNDTAVFRDTNGDDTYSTWWNRAILSGDGYWNEANGFDRTTAFSTGGNDTAIFRDTAGDDVYTTWSDRAIMYGDGYRNEAYDFGRTTAYATTGNDIAVFRDTAGDDFYSTWWNRAVMYGDGFWNDARGFDRTTAIATTGNDIAVFRDTAGDDFYSTWWNRAVMYGDGFWNDAQGFDRTTAYASTGNDIAVFRDTAGDDIYTTWWNRAILYGDGFRNDAQGFDRTTAYATGGNDIAIFRDSAGDDIYTTWWNRAIMYGDGFRNDAQGFDRTTAYSTAGNDIAVFRDSAGNDTYSTWWNRAIMSGTGYQNEALGFGRTTAYSTGGYDTAILRDSSAHDEVHASNTTAYITGTNYRNQAEGFDQIDVRDEDGDSTDEAFVGAVDAIFNLYGNWS